MDADYILALFQHFYAFSHYYYKSLWIVSEKFYHFTEEETKEWRDEITCLRFCSHNLATNENFFHQIVKKALYSNNLFQIWEMMTDYIVDFTVFYEF